MAHDKLCWIQPPNQEQTTTLFFPFFFLNLESLFLILSLSFPNKLVYFFKPSPLCWKGSICMNSASDHLNSETIIYQFLPLLLYISLSTSTFILHEWMNDVSMIPLLVSEMHDMVSSRYRFQKLRFMSLVPMLN